MLVEIAASRCPPPRGVWVPSGLYFWTCAITKPGEAREASSDRRLGPVGLMIGVAQTLITLPHRSVAHWRRRCRLRGRYCAVSSGSGTNTSTDASANVLMPLRNPRTLLSL